MGPFTDCEQRTTSNEPVRAQATSSVVRDRPLRPRSGCRSSADELTGSDPPRTSDGDDYGRRSDASVLPRDGASGVENTPRLPFSFVTRDGRTIVVCPYGDRLAGNEFEPLVAMYGAFDPADRVQGRPPSGGDRIRAWLEELLVGPNVVAWHHDAVAGHAALVTARSDRYEIVSFVHRAYRRSEIERRLTASLLDRGRREDPSGRHDGA